MINANPSPRGVKPPLEDIWLMNIPNGRKQRPRNKSKVTCAGLPTSLRTMRFPISSNALMVYVSAMPLSRKERNSVRVYRAWIAPSSTSTQVGLSDCAAHTAGNRYPRHGSTNTSTAIYSGVMVPKANSCLRDTLNVVARTYRIPIDRPVGKKKSQSVCSLVVVASQLYFLADDNDNNNDDVNDDDNNGDDNDDKGGG